MAEKHTLMRIRKDAIDALINVTLPLGIIVGGFLALDYHIKHRKPPVPISTETYIDEYVLYDGAVKLKEIEEVGDFGIDGRNVSLSTKYQFEFNEPGHYLFEGWAHRYRATDEKIGNWQFDIINAPFTITEDVYSFVYRLEASRIVDGKIIRKTINPKHQGGLGGGIYGVGHPLSNARHE